LRKMLCGNFSESREKKLKLEDVDGTAFVKVLDVWCGRKDCQEVALGELQQLASVADRFQMTEVTSVLEAAAIEKLSVDMCGEVLAWSGRCGMHQLESEALEMAAERFEEFARTAGFELIEEQALAIVLDNDRLVARNEEAVWEAVVGWMRGAAGEMRGRGVVGRIRFPLMEEEYLRDRVAESVCEEHQEWMARVVLEALRAKAARREGAVLECELLGRKALEDRVGLGVRWEEYREGGELRLGGHLDDVNAIVACNGRMCSGACDGFIRVWSRATGEHERTLQADDEFDDHDVENIRALAVWEGRLISGHLSGKLRVWNVATGICTQVLEGHPRAVQALAVSGSRLASGSSDGSLKVWAMSAGAPCTCERELLGHTGWVRSLAGWEDKVASGSSDGSIRVWDAGTGALVATLAGHSGRVHALVVHGDRLLSASSDGTIRAWAVGTWAGLRTVEAYGRETRSYPCCLAVSGSKLVSGSWAPAPSKAEVRVWGLAELDLQQTLPQPAGSDGVRALVAVDGEVWGAVGKEVVVWGKRR
jgi:hypothetical protein